jgi:DNA-binding GntR family transcriptional regulator
MAAALEADDFYAFARLDAEFNQLCLAACGNAIAASMMRLISTQNRRFWFIHHGRTLPRAGVESHVEIARAIASADADRAAKATERLLVYVEETGAALASCGPLTEAGRSPATLSGASGCAMRTYREIAGALRPALGMVR